MIYEIGNVELSAVSEVITNDPLPAVTDHCPAGGVVPVTQIWGAEFVRQYSSVMVHVFPPVPHVVVFTVFIASGGRLD